MRFWLLLFLFIGFASSGFGQEHGLLYSIKGKGNKTSYLFGTIHIIADSAFYFPQKLEKTFGKADKLVLEIGNITDQLAAMRLLELESGSAFDIFSKEQADSVITWGATALHISPEAFRSTFTSKRPFALMQIGAQTMVEGPVRSYELEFVSRATEVNMPVTGLETMEFQLSLFNNLPDSIIREMILSEIRHPEEQQENQRQLTQLYINQDLDSLTSLINGADELNGAIETLVYNRNADWIPKMEALMADQSCFFAVGAGHLGGEKGIIQLLRHAGYTVTVIPY